MLKNVKKINGWLIIAFILILLGFIATEILSTMLISMGCWIIGWNIVKPYIEGNENG